MIEYLFVLLNFQGLVFGREGQSSESALLFCHAHTLWDTTPSRGLVNTPNKFPVGGLAYELDQAVFYFQNNDTCTQTFRTLTSLGIQPAFSRRCLLLISACLYKIGYIHK